MGVLFHYLFCVTGSIAFSMLTFVPTMLLVYWSLEQYELANYTRPIEVRTKVSCVCR
jgi:hypothetical protein